MADRKSLWSKMCWMGKMKCGTIGGAEWCYYENKWAMRRGDRGSGMGLWMPCVLVNFLPLAKG